ncbi:coiled-coil domain-containing protein 174 isoform X2 [Nymphalis io]|uniref:coiled-coil domain-containing protein 174 isoform X2 n=1 Tax=Inachis io TaxID=171585 RepID=UPI002168FDA2|nr:coiled-coil domain-containing protein 174 isoform X2 [Nymphalis io]
MNEQKEKKILFNKSTLLSLKAELLKKQEEVQEKKHLPQHNLENFRPSHSEKKKNKTDGNNPIKKSLKDNLRAVDAEEFEACRRSKSVLEKKAKLYKHLTEGEGNSQLAGNFLVDFKGKKQEVLSKPESKSDELEEILPFEDDESEWTEFTDFLGRTRKCLKSDLDHYRKRDEELMKAMSIATKEEESDKVVETPQQPEKPFLVQKTNDYLQSLRDKWEQQERELLAKEKDIHYQDILFDEARIHGVGYYAFSTDETERRKQMEELVKRRQETLRAQEQAEEIRKKRDELIAARVAAARARQRARAGLPPEDPEEKKKDFTTCLLEFLTKQKTEADKKAKEEEEKKKEEKEKERQKFREAYIREWDVGKEGADRKVKKFREMTQEEYVEQQRSKRNDEFAPPQTANVSKSKYSFDTRGNRTKSDSTENNKNKSWSDVRPVNIPPPPIIGDISEAQKGLYFSTKKDEIVVKYKNFVRAEDPTPINNELCDEEDFGMERTKPEKRKCNSGGVEVEPPPTYEYYGPTSKQTRSEKPFTSDLREAMAQGSKSLEPKESTRQLPKCYDFTFE